MDITNINFEDVTIREAINTRGGGIEIDLTEFGMAGEKMAAYVNYLGGGMLGRVCVNDTINTKTPFVELELSQKLEAIGERLKRYAFMLIYPDLNDAEFEEAYTANQLRPITAY